MANPIIILLILYLVFCLAFYRRSLVVVLESLFALIIGFAVSVIYFDQVLSLVFALGMRENVYTPSLIFILLVIVSWAIFFTIFSILFNVGHIVKSYKTRYLALIISILFTLVVGSIACLTIIPFLQSSQIQTQVEDCFLCKFVTNRMSNIDSLDGNLSKVSPDVYMPENEQKVMKLSAEFEVSTLNTTKSRLAFEMVNTHRAKASEESLAWDDDLATLASRYGDEISQTKYFSHINESGKDSQQRALELGLKYDYLGENLAIGPTLQLAYDALVESESHYKNITSPFFSKAGIAVFDLDNGYILLIQEFAS